MRRKETTEPDIEEQEDSKPACWISSTPSSPSSPSSALSPTPPPPE